MKISIICFLIVIGYAQSSNDGHHRWNYDKEGPDFWREEFKNCKGHKQSPIDIKKDSVEYDKNLKPFKFSKYDKTLLWNVSHNGHTVVVSKSIYQEPETISVDGSDFDEEFKLLQFHFHWGYNDYQGSEHLIEGEKFPLEMHLVHKSDNGTYSVLGFLFKLSTENNTNLDALLEGVSEARGKEKWKEVSFSLDSILPDLSKLSYYRYLGSLTTPPCTEGVIWNVFTSYIYISSEQLMSFRNNFLKLNFRDPQKIYSRQVYTSFEVPSRQIARTQTEQCVFPNGSVDTVRVITLNAVLSILGSLFIIKLF